MTDRAHSDHRFRPLRHALTSLALHADDPPWSAEQRLSAAVALVLRDAEDLDVLLIKRATSERDPWSGQIALPGGRRDQTDGSLQHTAVRETHEEVGLRLTSTTLLGRMGELKPGTRRLPISTISPFVFGVARESEARVASPEVAEVFWVPLPDLADPSVRSTVSIPLPEGPRTFPCYRVGGEVVWGLTYRILSQFMVIWSGASDLPSRGRPPGLDRTFDLNIDPDPSRG